MAVSVYFNNVRQRSEQRMYENIAIEMIRLYGIDTYYLPRTTGNLDPLFGEDTTSSFNRAFLIEMYIKNSSKGFYGLGDFVSDAGAEIGDKITLVVARRPWTNEIGDYMGEQPRPNEGDLVFLPFNNKAFRVTFVEHESVFYQNGALYVWELNCELFSYGGEVFNTGIPEIDGMTKGFNLNILGIGLLMENGVSSVALEDTGLPLLTEDYTDESDNNSLLERNDYYQKHGYEIIDFSEVDPLLGNPTF
jgi:hypothetical protein